MTAPLYHFDPKDLLVTFGEVLVEGFADDSYLTIDQVEDDAQIYVGADGQGTRSMSNNNAATIELVLAASSPTNALLSALSKVDRTTGKGVRALLIKDKNGNDLFLAAKAWIQRRPRREWGKQQGARTWTFATHDLDDLDGGSSAPPLPA